MGEAGSREWTSADSALWRSLTLLADRRAGRLPEQLVDPGFSLAEGEIALAEGPFVMDALRDAEGGYTHDPAQMFTARVIGASDAPLLGDGQAVPARGSWQPDFSGELTVTSHGFYLRTDEELHRWLWQDIVQAEVVAFTVAVLRGHSENGPISWRLRSEWAELVFVLWAMAVNSSHPQLVDGSWLPENWIEWAASVGYPLPPGVLHDLS